MKFEVKVHRDRKKSRRSNLKILFKQNFSIGCRFSVSVAHENQPNLIKEEQGETKWETVRYTQS